MPFNDDLEYQEIDVWVDEIKIGDLVAGFVVTGVHASEHYRESAVRLSIFTDPDMLPEDVKPEEFGRMVLRTDRKKGHKIPVMRPVRD